jgi:hypothetical protein
MKDFRPIQCLPKHGLSPLVNSVHLKHVLREVNADRRNVHPDAPVASVSARAFCAVTFYDELGASIPLDRGHRLEMCERNSKDLPVDVNPSLCDRRCKQVVRLRNSNRPLLSITVLWPKCNPRVRSSIVTRPARAQYFRQVFRTPV